VTIIATITDFDFDILSGEYRVDGGSWMSFPQNGVSPLAVASVFNFPNGYTEGAHTYQVRGFDGYVYGSIASSSFTITDTTAPLVLWNIKPGATSLVNQACISMPDMGISGHTIRMLQLLSSSTE
jgi:hypothetical protein